MLFELFKDLAKLVLIVLSIEFGIRTYVQSRMPGWIQPLQKRRVLILWILVSAAGAIKVTEDVLGQESGPLDEALLWSIHHGISPWWSPVFHAITATGSATALSGVVGFFVLLFVRFRLFAEAWLLMTSALVAPLLIYAIKTIVGRARPGLWEARPYWGSSFPSGHTLAVASIAIALALCVSRLRPRFSGMAMGLASGWIAFVALSRLVLGVHWPTDVLTAACLGALIPLTLGIALELREATRNSASQSSR